MNNKYQLVKAGRVVSYIRADKVSASLVKQLYSKGYIIRGTYNGK